MLHDVELKTESAIDPAKAKVHVGHAKGIVAEIYSRKKLETMIDNDKSQDDFIEVLDCLYRELAKAFKYL